jgi:hypothetical protein
VVATAIALLIATRGFAAPGPWHPVVRVGGVWGTAMKMTPHPRLHQPDMVHPTAAGTYLAAAVFYRSLTGRPSAASTYTRAALGGQAEVQAGVRGAGHPHRGGGVLEKGRALGT